MTKYNTLQNDIENILKAFEGSKKTDEHESNRGAQVLAGMTYKRDHIFPRPDELFSLTQECNLQFHRALGLILKGEWERGFGCEKNGSPDKATQPFREVLSDAVEHTPEAINFNPDTAKLFAVFQRNGNQTTEAGYENEGDFDTLVQQMILAELHLASNTGSEMVRFVETETARQAMLRDSSEVERKAFWTERCRWVLAQEELDTKHEEVERWRLMNAETKREYQSLFGRWEVELQDAFVRWWPLNLRKMLKETDPSLSEEKIAEKIATAATFNEEKEKLKKLRHDEATLAHILPHMAGSGIQMDVDQVREYRAQAKSLLRKLHFKIHPDVLKNNPAYLKLSETQKNLLKAMLQQALEISYSELGFPPGSVEGDMRSIPGLIECLSRVDAILESAGLETRIEAQIQGRTLAEQLEWIKRTIVSLERRLEEAKAELHALATEPDVKRKRAFLACSDQEQQNYRDELKRKTAEYLVKADQMEEEVNASFAQKKG